MIIKKFKIKNFRSITDPYEFPLSNFTVLIGPNNEGKSNILQALIFALNLLFNFSQVIKRTIHIRRRRLLIEETRSINYDRERDFPLQLNGKRGKDSEFFITFGLNDTEKKAFKSKTRYSLKGDFGVKIKGDETVELFDGKKRINELDNMIGFKNIGKFIKKRWAFQYIPSIRTSGFSVDMAEKMIEEELAKLDEEKYYLSAIRKLEEFQKPIINELSSRLTKAMGLFFPNVKKVRLVSENEIRKLIRQSCKLYIDDGVETLIDRKGDGVKSLTAISILHNRISTSKRKGGFFLAIEEPEAHLHPKAIRRLKQVILDIAKENQVIISTHCPCFAEKEEMKKNIIVTKAKLYPAESIKEVRNILGVQISDNLLSANHVLLVEGKEDEKIIKSFLRSSQTLKRLFSEGKLVIDNLGGSKNLAYKASQYQNLLCKTYAFLDNDESGRESYEKVNSLNLMDLKDVFFANLPGYKNSEIEDLIEPILYKDKIYQKFGVSLRGKRFRNNKNKWSERVKKVFLYEGKTWNAIILKEIKETIANLVEKSWSRALSKNGKMVIGKLISHLENQIKKQVLI